ncbi:basic helix-loop-helix protein [Exophiala xenobiotica]
MEAPDPKMNSNNKRKRGPGDQGGGRESKAQNTNGDHQDYAALLQGLEGVTGTDDSTRTAQAALAAPMNQSAYPEPPSFDGAAALSSAFDENSPPAMSGMVERRRREVINEGIENIAKIVPCSEKNKGAILQRTHQYILEMQAEKAQFQTERATFEIALRELTNRLDRMKESARTAWAESNKWQQRCRDAGLHFDDFDEGTLTGLEEEDVTAADVVS